MFEAFEDPTRPTPVNMQFRLYSYGSKIFALCSASVSESSYDLACLDITGDVQSPGATAKIAPRDRSAASQRWVIENTDPARPETVTLRNLGSGRYLDSGANPQPGDRPRQQHFAPGASQQWFIKPVRGS